MKFIIVILLASLPFIVKSQNTIGYTYQELMENISSMKDVHIEGDSKVMGLRLVTCIRDSIPEKGNWGMAIYFLDSSDVVDRLVQSYSIQDISILIDILNKDLIKFDERKWINRSLTREYEIVLKRSEEGIFDLFIRRK